MYVRRSTYRWYGGRCAGRDDTSWFVFPCRVQGSYDEIWKAPPRSTLREFEEKPLHVWSSITSVTFSASAAKEKQVLFRAVSSVTDCSKHSSESPCAGKRHLLSDSDLLRKASREHLRILGGSKKSSEKANIHRDIFAIFGFAGEEDAPLAQRVNVLVKRLRRDLSKSKLYQQTRGASFHRVTHDRLRHCIPTVAARILPGLANAP